MGEEFREVVFVDLLGKGMSGSWRGSVVFVGYRKDCTY